MAEAICISDKPCTYKVAQKRHMAERRYLKDQGVWGSRMVYKYVEVPVEWQPGERREVEGLALPTGERMDRPSIVEQKTTRSEPVLDSDGRQTHDKDGVPVYRKLGPWVVPVESELGQEYLAQQEQVAENHSAAAELKAAGDAEVLDHLAKAGLDELKLRMAKSLFLEEEQRVVVTGDGTQCRWRSIDRDELVPLATGIAEVLKAMGITDRPKRNTK